MARLVTIAARRIVERGRTYIPGRAVQIDDEAEYHHLLRSGRFRDPDKILDFIRPDRMLPRIAPRSLVTVVREVGLGDVLMVLVVIRALKEQYPRLTFRLATGREYLPLVGKPDFLEGGAEAFMDLRGRIANVVDLRNLVERHERREVMDRIDIFALHCGARVHDYSLPIAPVTEAERIRARELMVTSAPTIALAVRGSTHVRTWPIAHVRSFASLAAERGWSVAVLDAGAHEMPAHPRIVNLTGRLSISEVKAVVAESAFCVSPDSGLQHVAEAVGTRCLAIYSTTPPALRLSHYRYVRALWRQSLPCVPCFDRGCPTAPCMQIRPHDVLDALESWEALPLSTNVDSAPGREPLIAVDAESRIMSAWLDQSRPWSPG